MAQCRIKSFTLLTQRLLPHQRTALCQLCCLCFFPRPSECRFTAYLPSPTRHFVSACCLLLVVIFCHTGHKILSTRISWSKSVSPARFAESPLCDRRSLSRRGSSLRKPSWRCREWAALQHATDAWTFNSWVFSGTLFLEIVCKEASQGNQVWAWHC